MLRVGSINLHNFNEPGKVVPSEVNERVIRLTLDETLDEPKKIPCMVGVASDSARHKVVRAALGAHLIDVLVTDHLTAKALLGKSRQIKHRKSFLDTAKVPLPSAAAKLARAQIPSTTKAS